MKGALFKTAAIALPLALVACGPAPGDPSRQVGPNPYLPPIDQYLLPPMHVANVVGWNGATPTVPAGLKVQALPPALRIRAPCMFCRMAMCWWSRPEVLRGRSAGRRNSS